MAASMSNPFLGAKYRIIYPVWINVKSMKAKAKSWYNIKQDTNK